MIIRSIALITAFMTTPVYLQAADSLPPKPDFEKRFDYVAWFEDALGKPSPNAYAEYARFMPGLQGSKVKEDAWPKFEGMISNPNAEPTLGPWDPAEHADWEASYQRTKETLAKFKAASRMDRFAAPTGLSRGREQFENLLMHARLPQLQMMRDCASGALEAAWRRDKDGVSPAAMQDSIESALRLARQLEQGRWVIEHVTASAIRAAAYRQVQWAFAHKVFTEKEAGGLQAVLRKIDGAPIENQRAVSGDAAAGFDRLQFVFGPQGGGGQSHVDPKRLQQVTGVSLGFNKMAFGSRIESDAAGCGEAMANVYRTAHSHFGRALSPKGIAPIHEAAEAALRLNQLMRAINPSDLSNFYATCLKLETQRRGTQTLVEIFAYKARKGKFPPKLSNLNKQMLTAIGNDPMSGKPFVYQTTDDGFLLYSVSYDEKDDQGAHREDWGMDGDFVFWPLPDSSKMVVAAKIKAAKPEAYTPLVKVTPEMVGKEITVVGRVTKVESRNSRQFRRIFIVTLDDAGAKLPLVYYAEVADALGAKQEIKAGLKIRAVARVDKDEKGALRLMLKDADSLVVEKTEDQPSP